MRFDLIPIIAALASPIAASVVDPWDALAAKALYKQTQHQFSHPNVKSTCTPQTAAVRREWGSLSHHERKEYTDAVLCLASKPSRINHTFAPGARSRYDDFVATHINQTMYIHDTGNFLTWHRYFTWIYEQTLRNECGYTGYQPYWAWNKYAHDPENSPVFDGSPYSMSGNGDYIRHNDSELAPGIYIPTGNGGGCVSTGPFKNWTVNLGPVQPIEKLPGLVAQNGSGLNYNPRCLRRDISAYCAQWTTTEVVMDLLVNQTTILNFQNKMQGLVNSTDFYLGLHGGGHYTIGGDPADDFFVSPGDPMFYLHHSAIDRMFWTWQNLDPAHRTYVVGGNVKPANTSSPLTKIDDIVDPGVALGAPRTIRELLDTTSGPFCYVYL
ncbi:hypothetical protein ASPWEDRAFT_51984 [Aspergillus wentii DTO 134E9]|uniref:Tyrosinase copper-binding domain-containing protein n=1 Tax=Aspergillus wentii DTO 134E9 TaxID=1073089 RepID=A0A1L9RMH3_ASPWE|nr:uncharacterized protein ASPWEDRAFT_51984 [Aspergillus wentii DTO 134E9]KAI9929412.1 hypothetical protein MW887_000882 [Aspergillus wentii]OJJ36145.1 hypothetical protein ASPWEDRAFT_51984 [Aspergillus wentii DTO 134E9]